MIVLENVGAVFPPCSPLPPRSYPCMWLKFRSVTHCCPHSQRNCTGPCLWGWESGVTIHSFVIGHTIISSFFLYQVDLVLRMFFSSFPPHPSIPTRFLSSLVPPAFLDQPLSLPTNTHHVPRCVSIQLCFRFCHRRGMSAGNSPKTSILRLSSGKLGCGQELSPSVGTNCRGVSTQGKSS